MIALKQKVGMACEHNSACLSDSVTHMFGLSSRSRQRKEPTWTQAPTGDAHVEPVWRDRTVAVPHEPTQQQAALPRKRSSSRAWISVALALVGLLVVAYLMLSMFSVVQEQVARNQPHPAAGASGMTLISVPAGR